MKCKLLKTIEGVKTNKKLQNRPISQLRILISITDESHRIIIITGQIMYNTRRNP